MQMCKVDIAEEFKSEVGDRRLESAQALVKKQARLSTFASSAFSVFPESGCEDYR